MSDYTLRAATEADLPLLCTLEAAAFRDAWREGEIRSHLHSATAITLICEDGAGDAAGYLFGSCLPPEGEVYRIAVPSERRGCGIGRFIMQGFLNILENNGADVCFLEVREGNTAARALYAAVGFTAVGLRKNYYKDPPEHALVLKRG